MANMEKICEFFSKDTYATKATGCVIEAAEKNYARCGLDITDIHKNAMGAVMGGVFFTLADFTFAIASNIDSSPTVSVSGQITHLAPVKGTKLTAEAKCLHDGRSGCSFLVSITDDLGRDVASVTFYGMRLKGEPAITSE